MPYSSSCRWMVTLVAALSAWMLSATARGGEVLVYGATPAGIAAAIAAADDGQRVTLIEPTARIGGLVTNGLSHTDFHSFESLTGAFLDFSQRVEKHYHETYGPDAPQVAASFRGTFGEPKVNLAIFQQMLAERKGLVLATELRLTSVQLNAAGTRIASATFADQDGKPAIQTADVFIDATYEGDLLALAGVPWHAGREGKETYGESLAPEQGDGQLQAYNFRWIMTREAQNRVTPVAPPGYRREDFAPVVALLESGHFKSIFGYPSHCIFKAQTPALPNGKYDINDVSRELVRLSLPGQNLGWPNGDFAARAQIVAAHHRDQAGLLYFLQNDEAVPENFRQEARAWGWCRDEFTENNHLPLQLYVREARRMIGQYVFTERDSDYAEGDARAVLQTDAIASGDYGNNCHGTAHEGPRFGGKHVGEFYKACPPYQIPYGVIVPKTLENLLVPTAVSSSHVGFCALRLEPIWMSLGQAAGHAAHLSIHAQAPVQQVSVGRLQARLHHVGSATIYVSDVLPGHADFALVQWWGTAGGLHGLFPTPQKRGERGRNLHGQYFEAYPYHAAELDKLLDGSTAQRWQALAKALQLESPVVRAGMTRREFLRQVGEQRK